MLRVQGYVHRHEFLIDQARGKKVLDCGVIGETVADARARIEAIPRGLHWQIAQVSDAVGTDLDSRLVNEVAAAYPALNLVAADIETIDLDERFELIIIGDLIEHLSNPGLALDRVRGLLADGGELVVTTPNAFGLPNFVRFLEGRYYEGTDHVASYNKWTLSHLLERHRFVVTGVWTALDRDPRSLTRKRFYRGAEAVLRRLPELGGTLIVKARKNG